MAKIFFFLNGFFMFATSTMSSRATKTCTSHSLCCQVRHFRCRMGVEPILVSSAISGVLAQRLIRCICKHCKDAYIPDAKDLPSDFKMEKGEKIFRGAGCRECRQTGYRGRLGIYELLVIDDQMREMILLRKSATEIQAAARANGLKLMREDGWVKVRKGISTFEEIVRVTKIDAAALGQ